MNKKFIKLAMFGALIFASTGTFISCQDYDDDIDNLKVMIKANEDEIGKIKEQLNNGQWVKSVEQSANGITVTLGNGSTYEITNGKNGADGSNGTNGADGKPGSVVSISNTGEWLIDGVGTGRFAQGTNGTDGTNGSDGQDGKDGAYYYPGTEGSEAGFWIKVDADGTKTKTDISWKASTTGASIYAIVDGKTVKFYGLTNDGSVIEIPTGVATLRSLVFVPDMLLDGVPAIDCSMLKFQPYKKTSGMTGTVGNDVKDGSSMACTPAVQAVYHLNPSNVTEEMIDTKSLAFAYKEAKYVTRSAAINPKATFNKVSDGKITVDVNIDGVHLYNTKSDKDGEGRFDLIALQAPVSAVAKSINNDAPEIVTSDYATLYGGSEILGTDLYPARTNILTTAGDDAHYVKTLQEAKNMALTDARILKVVYNSNIKLGDYLSTCWLQGVTHKVFPYSERYHLSYKFDMEGISYKMVEAGLLVETEQQEFIALDETTGTATPKVYTTDGKAAIGRTPIIRACLVHTENGVDKIVKVVYIKLLITDKDNVDPGTRTFDLTLKNLSQSLCADITNEVTAEQMNVQVYSQLGLSKEQFHNIYTFDAAASAGVSESQNAGGQKTYGLTWTVTSRKLWDNAGGTVTAEAVYKANNGDKIVIKLTSKVAEKEVITIPSNKKIPNYWEENLSIVKLNVYIPAVGETNSALCIFTNNLNAPFYTDANGKLDIIPSSSMYYGSNIDFVFDNTPVVSPTGYSFSVTNNGTRLMSGLELIAEIDNSLAAAPWNVIKLNENSEIAKKLLNTANFVVNLKLKADKCGFEIPFANNGVFKAKFLRPVHVNTSAPGNFIDGVDFGATGSVLKPASVISYYDWRGKWETNYPQYYGVVGAAIDANRDIMCTLGENKTWIKLPTTLEVGQFTAANVISGYNVGDYYYKNNGVVLSEQFDIKLPIKVEYKWGTVNTEVTVKVEQTTVVPTAKRR